MTERAPGARLKPSFQPAESAGARQLAAIGVPDGGAMQLRAKATSERERRKYARIPTDQLISFAPIEAPDRLAVGKNLSTGGICFEVVGCEITLGEVLRLTFNVQDETIVATGRVVWCTDVDAFTQEVGLEFLEIDPFALETIERSAEGSPAD
jgi:hypothetical protein